MKKKPNPAARWNIKLEIDFWDAVRGGVKNIQIARMDSCETCHGTGADRLCRRPARLATAQAPFSSMPARCVSTCRAPAAAAPVNFAPRARLAAAKAGSAARKRLTCAFLPVLLPADAVRVPGKGNAGTMGAPAGDLYLSRRSEATSDFSSDAANDLYTKVPRDGERSDARRKVEVPTIDGRSLVRIPPATNSGSTLAPARKGGAQRAQRRTRRSVRGDSGGRARNRPTSASAR